MKKCLIFVVCVLLMMSAEAVTVKAAAQENPGNAVLDASIQAVLEELKNLYSTEIILGSPMEVNGLKIIPLAIAGFAFGECGGCEYMGKGQGKLGGAGGVMSPVGVLVISGQEVQLLQLSKGFVEQLGGALAPIIVESLSREPDGAEERGVPVERKKPETISVTQLFTKFRKFLDALRIVITILFLLAWVALMLIIDLFLPRQVSAITSTLQERTSRTALTGIVSVIVVLLLSAVLTISLIGIPLTFVVIILTCALMLFGSVGLALLVGQKIAAALFKQSKYSDVLLVLIGGIVLGILGIIPIPLFGPLVWIIIGILGLGSVLLLQWENVRKIEN